jgi:RNA polymerase sigma factor (TIGR02999 family)
VAYAGAAANSAVLANSANTNNDFMNPPEACGAVVFHNPVSRAEILRSPMACCENGAPREWRMTTEVTALLAAMRRGEARAVDDLFALLYPDLRQLAHARLRHSGSFTLLETTALVHESYLRLLRAGSLKAGDRGQFMAYAARVMRSVVVDFVRHRVAERRGGDAVHLELGEEVAELADPGEREVVRVNEALQELAAIDERLVRVVEMRYFAGMTEEQVAEALDLSRRSVSRDWEKARLFLADALD